MYQSCHRAVVSARYWFMVSVDCNVVESEVVPLVITCLSRNMKNATAAITNIRINQGHTGARLLG